jgi:hypothetical protein
MLFLIPQDHFQKHLHTLANSAARCFCWARHHGGFVSSDLEIHERSLTSMEMIPGKIVPGKFNADFEGTNVVLDPLINDDLAWMTIWNLKAWWLVIASRPVNSDSAWPATNQTPMTSQHNHFAFGQPNDINWATRPK